MKLLKIVSILISFLLSLMFIDLVIDINSNPEVYKQIYRISASSDYWSKKSITNFLIEHYMNLFAFVVIMIFNIYSLIKRSKFLNIASIAFFILIVFWIVYHLFMYFTDGFGY